MIYQLYPGSPIPNLKIGDSVIIRGKKFLYRGEVEDKSSIPKKAVGLYLCKDSNNYYLHHPKRDTEIIQEYNAYMVQNIAMDTAPITREKKNKDVFVLPIYSEDNYLKVVLKRILIKLQIDFNDYRYKFVSDNHFNNTKRAIQGTSNISFEKFIEILDILDLSYNIDIFRKNGEKLDIDIVDSEIMKQK
jgi:hypothetical protein